MQIPTIEIQLRAGVGQLQQDMSSAQGAVSSATSQMQKSAQAATTSFTEVARALGGSGVAARDYVNSVLGIVDADNRASYANKKLAESLNDQIRSMTLSRSELTLFKTSLPGASQEVQELGRRLAQLQGAQDAYSESVGHGGHEMEGFSLKTTGARRELLVLAHELSQGNYSRFGGSLMVLGERTNFMSLAFSAAGLQVIALVGSLAALSVAVIKGSMESSELNKQMQLTGNYAGFTAGQFGQMAEKMAEGSRSGIGAAREMLTGLSGAGMMSADTLKIAGTAALDFSHLSGKSSEEVIADFSKMSGGVAKWAEEHNRSYHFLTAAQFIHIDTLEKEGHTQEAMQATMQAFDDHAKVNVQNLGLLQRGWDSTTHALSYFWDTLKSIGRDTTIEDKVRATEQKLKDIKADQAALAGGDKNDSDNARRLKAAKARAEQDLVVLKTQQDLEESDKRDLALQQKLHEVAIQAAKDDQALKDSFKTREEQGEDAVKKYILGQKAIRTEGTLTADSEATQAKIIAAIRESYSSPEAIDKADTYRLEAALKRIQRETDLTKEHYQDLAKLDDLYHSAGEISDAKFYENKRSNASVHAIAETEGYDRQLQVLVAHDNANETEEEKTQKAIDDIWDKRIRAAERRDAALRLIDEEERLRQRKVQMDSDALVNGYLSGLQKEIDKLSESNLAKEKSKAAAEEHQVAILNDAIAYQEEFMAQQQRNGATEAELEQAPKILKYLTDQRDLRKQIAEKLATADIDKANLQAAEAAKEAWKHTAKSIEDDLTNAILDGGGKGWKKLIKDMEFAFARMILQPILAPIAGGIASFLNPTAPQANGGALAGTSALINQASAANSLYNLYNGGLAGSLGSGISALGGFTGSTTLSAFGSGLSGVAGGTYAGMGATVAGSETGLGALVGSSSAGAGSSAAAAMAAIPGWGWAALGAAAIGAYLLSGGGPISNSRLTFGSNNAPGNISINERGNEGQNSNPYINNFGTSSLGTFGVTSSYWMNAGQPAVQDFIKTVSQTDDVLASFMTTAEKASVSSYLTGKTNTANTGSEDANPNANGQLDKVFADRITNILNGIEPGLALLTAGFAGTSQALATEAGALLQYRAALKDSGEAVFGVKVTLQEIAALKEPTELTSAALTRITNEFTVTNQAAQLLGKDSATAFGAAGLASIKAREQLIQFAGSATELATQTASFSQNYFTDAERLIPVTKAVDAAMASLGLSAITSREQFKALASSLDLANASDAKEFASLMALQEAFAQVHPAIVATTTAVQDLTAASTAAGTAAQASSEEAGLSIQLMEALGNAEGALAAKRHDALAALLSDTARATQTQIWAAQDAAAAIAAAQSNAASVRTSAEAAASSAQQGVDAARAALTSSYQREQSSLQALVNTKLAEAAATQKQMDALKLGSLSALTPEAQYAEAQRQFEQASGADKATAASAFLTISQQFNGSTEAYRRDFELVQAGLADSARASEQQVSDSQAQLSLLEDQVTGLVTLNSSVLSVTEAIDELKASMQVLGRAQAAVAALPPASVSPAVVPPSGTGGAPSASSDKPANLQAIDAGLENLYQSTLNRHSDPSGLAFWENAVANQGVSLSEVATSFVSSPEYHTLKGFASGGYHSGGWRVVGEEGPELEATGPSRILDAKQTAAIFGGDSEGSVKELKEVKALLQVIAGKRADSSDLAAAVQLLAKKVDSLSREQALMRQKI